MSDAPNAGLGEPAVGIAGERRLHFAFQESREQLFRNARGWGIDVERREQEGLLRVVCEYPEHAGFEDHLVRMTKAIEAFMPNRVVAAPEPVGRSGKAAGGAV